MDGEKEPNFKLMIIATIVLSILLIGAFAGITLLAMSYANPPAPSNSISLTLAGNDSVTDDQVEAMMKVLDDRFKSLGESTLITSERYGHGVVTIKISYGNISQSLVESVATTPGQFELRIRTAGNESEHVLSASDIQSVDGPVGMPAADGSISYGLSIRMTPSGADAFRDACMRSGAITGPQNHTFLLMLDGRVLNELPISSALAEKLAKQPADTIMALADENGTDRDQAALLKACIKGGPLPVAVAEVYQSP